MGLWRDILRGSLVFIGASLNFSLAFIWRRVLLTEMTPHWDIVIGTCLYSYGCSWWQLKWWPVDSNRWGLERWKASTCRVQPDSCQMVLIKVSLQDMTADFLLPISMVLGLITAANLPPRRINHNEAWFLARQNSSPRSMPISNRINSPLYISTYWDSQNILIPKPAS